MASIKTRQIQLLTGARTLVGGIPSYAAATPLLVKGLTVRRIEGDYEAQDFITGYEGAQGDRLFNGSMGLDFQVDAALPAPGDAPLYGPLLEACGFKAMAVAGTSVSYAMRPQGEAHAEIALRYRDAQSSQVTEGARGSMSFDAASKKPPMFSFKFLGALFDNQPTVAASGDFSGWPDAPECSPTNMTAFTVDNAELCVQQFTFSDGRAPTRGEYMNCDGTNIVARNITGRMVVRMPDANHLDVLALAKSGATVPLVWEIEHGGSKMRIAAPAVQIKYGGEQDINGEIGINLDLVFTHDQGDDEVAITFH